MRCDRFREAASARLDGEPLGVSPSVLEHHLAGCPDCARWVETATQVTRQARLVPVEVPDLADRIVHAAVLPTRRVLRYRTWLRIALVLLALVQLGIALPALTGHSIGMAMADHAAHEMAAWNLAIGAAFVAAALAPRRASGMIPMLATFVLVLGVLCVRDLADGAVSFGRVATHLAALAGLVVLLAVDRSERALPPHRAAARGPSTAEDEPRLRGVA